MQLETLDEILKSKTFWAVAFTKFHLVLCNSSNAR